MLRFLTRVRFALFFLGIVLALSVAACAKKANSETEAKQQAAHAGNETKPPTAEPALADLERFACQQTFNTADHALMRHLTHKPSERNQFLMSGLTKFLTEQAATDERAEVRAAAQAAISKLQGRVPDCALFHDVTAMYPAIEGVDFFSQLLWGSLRWLFRSLDANSNYVPPSTAARGIAGSIRGAGIRFLWRTDYGLGPKNGGRKPNYLVVDGFYDGSFNKDLPELQPATLTERTPTYVFAITRNDEKKSVSELGFWRAWIRINLVLDDASEVMLWVKHSLEPDAPLESVTARIGPYNFSLAHFLPISTTDRVGYVRLASFLPEEAGQFFNNALSGVFQSDLSKQENINALIFDLRGNGGGQSEQAGAILKTLVPSHSLIWHTVGVKDTPDTSPVTDNKALEREGVYTVGDQPHISDKALVVVLTDRSTASASEMVAAALRDHQRALIVGEKTFGKGVGQLAYTPPVGGSVFVTNFRWFSPTGASVQLDGILPDLDVGDDPANRYQHEKAPAPATMAEWKQASPDLVIPKPDPLDMRDSDFKPAGSSGLMDGLRARIKDLPWRSLQSCDPKWTPDNPAFKETDDCILDAAKLLVNSLLRPNAQTMIRK
ncbi:MAG: S41 family peptidase [Pseudomonadota bacterium]